VLEVSARHTLVQICEPIKDSLRNPILMVVLDNLEVKLATNKFHANFELFLHEEVLHTILHAFY